MTVMEAGACVDVEAVGVDALLAALEAKDHYTGTHSAAVLELAAAVGRRMRLSDGDLRELGHVALLHDVGKIGLPDSVLGKPGQLTAGERKLMERHPEIGERMLCRVPALSHLGPAVRAEHERFDGAGYPDGIAGEEIPLPSRITFVCDAYHAMCSDRPYRRALPGPTALAEVRRGRGTQFCPEATDALLKVLPDVVSAPDGTWHYVPG